jgi:hypothetical protein
MNIVEFDHCHKSGRSLPAAPQGIQLLKIVKRRTGWFPDFNTGQQDSTARQSHPTTSKKMLLSRGCVTLFIFSVSSFFLRNEKTYCQAQLVT